MIGPKTLATKVMGLFTSMDKMIGPDFEKGLARLKDVVETRSALLTPYASRLRVGDSAGFPPWARMAGP